MRLAFPRIKSLQSDDGTASITYQSVDMNRDTGGFTFLFVFKMPSGETTVNTTVARVTTYPARKKFLADTGKDLLDLSTTEMRKYIDKYAGEYGNTFEVRIFEVPSGTGDDDIVALRDAFCALFFEYWSSYEYNNSDDTSDPADRYPDTISFLPQNLNRKFHLTMLAGQGGKPPPK
ncbi:hypothetical protein [Bradyrhizobium manausense]|uniref:hypothetical protein n=1 Tax=Bradyrhizobium manausense TaxID=989370 RepID=UPI001BA89452|nr:hypothetical protein [Bradyrhizobium manausense]MBR0721082.1 hypothetical protein [Bradyrhizobium manausense]